MEKLKTNNQLELASEFLQRTNANIFLTGRAGTGKTTFLRNIALSTNKRIVVAAPTGIAALNARGVTLHSLFQLPFSPFLGVPRNDGTNKYRKMGKQKLAIIRTMDVLVIDEISMVRSDLLDAVDDTLRRLRGNSKPFGGVQLLMIGDVHQLSPICRDEDWMLLKDIYRSPYFFDSNALKQCNYISIELQEVFRQTDMSFVDILNAVRDNMITPEVMARLNERYMPDFSPSEEEGYITLTTHNYIANNINSDRLTALPSESQFFESEIEGDYPENIYPNDTELELKVGAQVIFIKNDISPAKLYYNGMIGHIVRVDDDRVIVQPRDGGEEIEVTAVKWENIEYIIDPITKEITENLKGFFSQIPLRCAWAITIHKSQGLSFDKAIIDAGGSFAYGQVYVALSRCRTLEGMVLKSPINRSSIMTDSNVDGYCRYVDENQPDDEKLDECKRGYYREMLEEIFSFKLLYQNTMKLSDFVNYNLSREYPVLSQTLSEAVDLMKPELVKVGDSFIVQLSRAVNESDDFNNDDYIKERLLKSSVYFSAKFQPLYDTLMEVFKLKTDSKEVNKRLERLIADVATILAIKKSAIELCGIGYTIEDYQRCKVEVLTQDVTKPAKKYKSTAKGRDEDLDPIEEDGDIVMIKKLSKISSDIIHEELYETLRQWRASIAEELGKSAFTILHNSALVNIQTILPITIEQLKKVKGVSKNKIESYGEEIIDIVADYCNEKNINPVVQRENLFTQFMDEQEKPDSEKKLSLKDSYETKYKGFNTFEMTLNMYTKEKLSVEDIAKIRSLSINTIQTHIARFIGSGELNLEDFVSKEKIEEIKAVLTDEKEGLTVIKEKLGEETTVTFSDIRMVLASIEE